MAEGDVTIFEQFLVDRDEQVHDLENDTFKVGIITRGSTPPAADDVEPNFGGTGFSNYQVTEVQGGTEYVAGGKVASVPTVNLVNGASVFDLNDVTWALDGSGPTDMGYAILFNNSDALKRALLSIDLGGALSLQDASLTIQFNVSGVLQTNAV